MHRALFVKALLVAAAIPTCRAAACDVRANVVAIEHAYQYNRFGAFNPAGMIFVLRHDVVPASYDAKAEEGYLKLSLAQRYEVKLAPGKVRLRADKRPRPLVLRVNEGSCIEVTFTNLLSPAPPSLTGRLVPERVLSPSGSEALVPFPVEESKYPATRRAGLHVNGLDYVNGPDQDDGAYVGNNKSSIPAPGDPPVTYRWHAVREGGYLLFSTAASTGGEGDGGQIGLGLFGSVNVEPKGSTWYRSQVTHDILTAAIKRGSQSYADLDYKDARLLVKDSDNWIVYSDINAIIAQDLKHPGEWGCGQVSPANTCGRSFREFTVIFHDEITAVQAFAELGDETNPISSVRDGMGINYGVSSMGAVVMANLKKVGPAAKCAECKFEEFFLSSWANGDPALLPEYEDDPSNVHHAYLGDPVRFRNIHAGPKETHVFHLHAHQWLYDQRDENSTYLDSQTISPGASYTYAIQYGGSGNRNFTVGDSIFHCHLYPHFAQGMWELWRSHDVFEDGTKGIWDPVFRPRGRSLPDGEIVDGTPNPAVVPIPGLALAPLPNEKFGGYPFYIPGLAGHRPPQPPLDMDADSKGNEEDGGLSRHVFTAGTAVFGNERTDNPLAEQLRGHPETDAAALGSQLAAFTAKRVAAQNANPAMTLFAKHLETATIRRLPSAGTASEKFAMRFHQGLAKDLDFHGLPGTLKPHNSFYEPTANPNRAWWHGMGYESKLAGGTGTGLFGVNGTIGRKLHDTPQPEPPNLSERGAPYSNPCPASAPKREYRAAYLQFDLTVNKWGWHDPQARVALLEDDVKDTIEGRRPAEPLFFRANSGDCISYAATNLIPSALNLDDFQIYSPTDIIGQHIHLVKFDVTASDGSGNGWNYEDGTLSPDEVRERIKAHNTTNPFDKIALKTNRLFKTGNLKDDDRGKCADVPGGKDDNPWCGAQTTTQRWYADPILNRNREDRTMRTVFTHDHFGPSSHQHHGLYAALVVEPKGSEWRTMDNRFQLGKPNPTLPNRGDGGPTSYRANIKVPCEAAKAVSSRPCVSALDRREFNLAFADFAILYTKAMEPINPPNRDDVQIPGGIEMDLKPMPEGISGGDPGTQLINYRNEPIPMRLASEKDDIYTQRSDKRGELANVFISGVHAATEKEALDAAGEFSPKSNIPQDLKDGLTNQTKAFVQRLSCRDLPEPNPFWCETWRVLGDPGTPVLATYEGDNLQVRLVQGAQEEQHVFTMTGGRWLMQVGDTWPKIAGNSLAWKAMKPDDQSAAQKSSGYTAAQQIGISEHMEFDAPVANRTNRDPEAPTDYLYMSSATDNLWDGMWGLLRIIPTAPPKTPSLARTPLGPRTQTRGLAPFVQRAAVVPDTKDVCPGLPNKKFHVGAWLARDLIDDGLGVVYNSRFALHDPNAIVFVEQDPRHNLNSSTSYPKRAAMLTELQAAYANGKPLEPLILRAAAGDCIDIHLHNYLTPEFDDRHKSIADGGGETQRGTFGLLPPLTNGLNTNQLRASARVGLHPQLLEVDMLSSGGVDVGGNGRSKPYDPLTVADDGTSISSTVGPIGSIFPKSEDEFRYLWYAGERRPSPRSAGNQKDLFVPAEFGAAALRNLADPIKGSSHGAIGMIIIEPKDTCVISPKSGDLKSAPAALSSAEVEEYKKAGYCTSAAGNDAQLQFYRSKATADIRNASNQKTLFRDFALLYQDDVSLLQGDVPLANLRGGDDSEDSGGKAFNYKTEPLWARIGAGSPEVHPEDMLARDFSNTLSSTAANGGCGHTTGTPPKGDPSCGDPETPVFTAPAGTEVRFRVVHAGGHPRQHGFTLFGHNWDDLPFKWVWDTSAGAWGQQIADNPYSAKRGTYSGIGPARHLNIRTCAGGHFARPGDYLFRTQEAFQFQGGLWGIFRVTENSGPTAEVCKAEPANTGARKEE